MFDLLTGTIDLFHDESVESIELDTLVGEEGDFLVAGIDPEFIRQFYPDYNTDTQNAYLQGHFNYVPNVGYIRLAWLNLTVGTEFDIDFYAEDQIEPTNRHYFEQSEVGFTVNVEVKQTEHTLSNFYLPYHCTWPVVYGTDTHRGTVLASKRLVLQGTVKITLVSLTDAVFTIPLMGDTGILDTSIEYPGVDTYAGLISAVAGTIASLQTKDRQGFSESSVVPSLKQGCELIGKLLQDAVPKLTHVINLDSVTASIRLY